MRLYETTFVINASLDDPQIENVIARIQDTVTKNGGSVTMLNKWGRKRLSYSINKKTTGFYVNLEFEAPPGMNGTLERAFQLDEQILRNLTIVLDKRAIAARKAAQAARQVAAEAGAQAAPAVSGPLATPAGSGPLPTPAAPREPLFPEKNEEQQSS
jgi:small subunit ribosomal protein S6